MSETALEATGGNGLDQSSPAPVAPVETNETAQPKEQPNWQKRHDRLQAEYEALRPWQQKGFTPARIAELMGTLETVLKEPTLGKAISTYVATGKAEFPGAEVAPAEDPYEDPSVKALRQELAATRAEIAMIRQSSQATATVTASDRVAGLNEKFLAAYPELTGDESQEFMRQLMPRLDQMIAGNPAAFQRLDADTFEAIALPVLNRVAPLRSLGQRAAQANQVQARQHATDAPLRVGTTGHEPQARPTASRHITDRQVNEGMRAAMREAFRRSGRPVE